MLLSEISKLNTNWKYILENKSDELQKIDKYLKDEKSTYEPGLVTLPPNEKIFEAFKYFNVEDLKVVFIGQDCYHKRGQANGMCFSVPDGVKIPPSLRNIIKEINDDIGIIRNQTDFSDLASQGILFLNSALTVREKCPASHMEVWINFTDSLLKDISDMTENVVFVLWGNYAKAKIKFINIKKHKVLQAKHPSPLSANRGGFFGCKHFSKINEYLISVNKKSITWNIVT